MRVKKQGNFVSRGQSKTAKGKALWPLNDYLDYFLALQVGQVAQVDLLSVQHFMPQAASFLVSHLPQQAQPLMRVATPTTAAHRVRDLMSFIWI